MNSKMCDFSKSPIPVLNQNSPHNYVIMSALLSHIDSTCSQSLSGKKSSNKSNNSSKSNRNSFIEETIKITNNQSSRTSSKDLVYTSKRLKSKKSKRSGNVSSDNASSLFDNSRKLQNINAVAPAAALNDFNFYPNLIEQTSSSSNFDTSFMINSTPSATSLVLDDVSGANTVDLIDSSNSFINHEQHETIDLNESQISSSENAMLKEHNYNENLQLEQQNDKVSVVYKITCPPEWELNLNRMINCYVSLDKSIEISCSTSLKCSVCGLAFACLDDLHEHKQLNSDCVCKLNVMDDEKDDDAQVESDIEDCDDEEVEYDENELDVFDEELCEQPTESDFEIEELKYLDEIEMTEDRELPESLVNNKNKLLNKLNHKLKHRKKVKIKKNSSNMLMLNLDSESESQQSSGQSDLPKSKSISDEDPEKTRPRRKYNKNKNVGHLTLTCEKCSKKCRTKAELLVHMHKHAGNPPECWECGKKCASYCNLVSHIQLHTGEKPFTCQFCGKTFTQDAHLTRHIRLHTGERPFVCNLCGKDYKDYSYYKTHLRIHKGERLYKCNYCNKEYYDASYYKKHTRLHTGEKPYMCTVCGRQFHRSDYLKLHSYSHTDERPFTCHICGKGFKMNYNLKLHLRNHDNHLIDSECASSADHDHDHDHHHHQLSKSILNLAYDEINDEPILDGLNATTVSEKSISSENNLISDNNQAHNEISSFFY